MATFKVGFERIDAFEAHAVGAKMLALGAAIAEALERQHEVLMVGEKSDGVAVGLRTSSCGRSG